MDYMHSKADKTASMTVLARFYCALELEFTNTVDWTMHSCCYDPKDSFIVISHCQSRNIKEKRHEDPLSVRRMVVKVQLDVTTTWSLVFDSELKMISMQNLSNENPS